MRRAGCRGRGRGRGRGRDRGSYRGRGCIIEIVHGAASLRIVSRVRVRMFTL